MLMARICNFCGMSCAGQLIVCPNCKNALPVASPAATAGYQPPFAPGGSGELRQAVFWLRLAAISLLAIAVVSVLFYADHVYGSIKAQQALEDFQNKTRGSGSQSFTPRTGGMDGSP